MEKIITKDELNKHLEAIRKIQEEIRQFTPIVLEELKSFSDTEYMSKVCNNSIDYQIREDYEGDFLFQCSNSNRRYFDRVNRLKIPSELIEEKAGVDVNVAGLSKFMIDCPHAGEFLCKLRYFSFDQNKPDEQITGYKGIKEA
jgi:hypothetical protein